MAIPSNNALNSSGPAQSKPIGVPQNTVNSTSPAPGGISPTPNTNIDLDGNNFANLLYQKKLLSSEQLNKIKFDAINSGKSVEEVLTESDIVSEDELYRLKAEIYNVPYVAVNEVRIPVEVLNKFDQSTARKNMAIAIEEDANRVKVAMVDPLDIQKVRFLSTMIGKKIDAVYSSPSAINSIIDTKYGAQISGDVTEALEDVGDVVDISSGLTLTETQDLQAEISSAPVSRIVNMILEYAAKYKASDVHIEPRETQIVVRYRMSGVLSEKLNLPKKLGNAVVSRIKILSNLKIDEHRIPQDGRFQIQVEKRVIDLRVSIMPSVYGEKVVMRLLEKGGQTLNLEDTGLRGRTYQLYLDAIKKTQGIILVTGPTGSGKTVTLAASLKLLNKPSVNIMTLEDPVEIRLDGITQVQINAEIGLTFAKGLRAFLRQDPDIIMVGEIRDKETAELAVQASLTGHLVLATLHTNSAAGALPRLTDMGIESFLLASTINIIGAQRLTRKICEKCKVSYDASPEQVKELSAVLNKMAGFSMDNIIAKGGGTLKLYKGQGCPQCGDSGYKGRLGIFEGFVMSDKLSAMTVSHESSQVIEKQAIEEGMVTMQQDGFLKVLEGATTMEEVLRVIT